MEEGVQTHIFTAACLSALKAYTTLSQYLTASPKHDNEF